MTTALEEIAALRPTPGTKRITDPSFDVARREGVLRAAEKAYIADGGLDLSDEIIIALMQNVIANMVQDRLLKPFVDKHLTSHTAPEREDLVDGMMNAFGAQDNNGCRRDLSEIIGLLSHAEQISPSADKNTLRTDTANVIVLLEELHSLFHDPSAHEAMLPFLRTKSGHARVHDATTGLARHHAGILNDIKVETRAAAADPVEVKDAEIALRPIGQGSVDQLADGVAEIMEQRPPRKLLFPETVYAYASAIAGGIFKIR